MDECRALNDLNDEETRAALTRCCGSIRWVERMQGERPFRDRAHLFEAASRHWNALDVADWDEAFSHHPRIGEPSGAAKSTASWAANEQAGASLSADDVRAAIAEGNRAYEARFGRIYLVCATGKTGEELLAILRARMGNDPATELRVAVGEQEKITRLRLEKILSP